MAVGYLSRASRRALPAVAPAPAPGVGSLKPATPTRSPLAEVDQRLHLDLFVTPPQAAPAVDMAPSENGPESPFSEAPARRDSPNAAPRPIQAETALYLAPESRQTRPASPKTRTAFTPRPVTSGPEQVRPAEARKVHRTTLAPASAHAGRPAPPAERVGRQPVPPPVEGVQPAPRTTSTSPDPSGREMDQMLAALRTAQRWVSATPPAEPPAIAPPSPPRLTSDTARPALSPTPAAQPSGFPSQAPSLRAAPKPQPLTRVEIGSIEVEIIAPPKPAVQPAQRASSRGARSVNARPGLSGGPSFGWRQR